MAYLEPELQTSVAMASGPDAPALRTLDFGDQSGELTILIPTYHDDASALVHALGKCAGAHRVRLVIYDDGSHDQVLEARLIQALLAFPGTARVMIADVNVGRSKARNILLSDAETDWVIFLDADMLPDDHLFLARYFDAVRQSTSPAVYCGGFSLKRAEVTDACKLHAAQSLASETISVAERNLAPGRYIFTSNLLVHKAVLHAVAFDGGYKGWGWEDVDWGLSVEQRYPVRHIDNSATHLGLDTDDALIAKYAGSGDNFARLAQRHPSASLTMPLYRVAKRLRCAGPAAIALQATCAWTAKSAILPTRVRLGALKLMRAAAYARSI